MPCYFTKNVIRTPNSFVAAVAVVAATAKRGALNKLPRMGSLLLFLIQPKTQVLWDIGRCLYPPSVLVLGLGNNNNTNQDERSPIYNRPASWSQREQTRLLMPRSFDGDRTIHYPMLR